LPHHKDREPHEEQRRTYWIDWKPAAIDAASLLHREDKLGAQLVRDQPGPYLLQAAIAACHARAESAADTDWAHIAALYGGMHPHTRTGIRPSQPWADDQPASAECTREL